MSRHPLFKYGEDTLTVQKVMGIVHGALSATISKKARVRIIESRKKVDVMALCNKAVYGINTGFGPLCDTQITPKETNQLQVNLLLSHAVGVGSPIEKKIAKAMMICKVHSLCKGYSGIRIKVIERIIHFIENDLIPIVPEQGSVGAS